MCFKRKAKRFIALLMSFVLVATIMPVTVVAQDLGQLDPVPLWGEKAQAIASVTDSGDVLVNFTKPQSPGNDPAQDVTYDYDNFIFKLYDVTDYETRNGKDAIPDLDSKFPYIKTVSADSLHASNVDGHNEVGYEMFITKAELEKAGITLSSDRYYCVSITIVNKALRDGKVVPARSGWRSEPLDAVVSPTPIYSSVNLADPDIMDHSKYFIRTLADFEGNNGVDNGYVINNNGLTDAQLFGLNNKKPGEAIMESELQTGNRSNWMTPNAVNTFYNRANEEAAQNASLFSISGVWDNAGADFSKAYRFVFKNDSDSRSSESTSIDMWDHRQEWNFMNAKEMWIWVDLSDVELDELYFRMRYNDKIVAENLGKNVGFDRLSNEVFTTKNYEGTKTVSYQNEEGFWAQRSIVDGNFASFSGYKGYIRIPMEMFVAYAPDYDFRNMASLSSLSGFNWQQDPPSDNPGMKYWRYDDNHSGYTILDKEGTKWYLSNEDSLLGTVRPGATYYLIPKYEVNSDGTIKMKRRKVSLDPDELYATHRYIGGTVSGIIERADNFHHLDIRGQEGKIATSDMMTFGFELSSPEGSDNANKAFYIDNIQGYYDTDQENLPNSPTKEPDDSATPNDKRLKDFYNPVVEIPTAIVNFIMKYIPENPSLADRQTVLSAESILTTCIDTDLNKAIDKLKAMDGIPNMTQAMERLEKGIGLIDVFSNYSDADLVAYLEQKLEFISNPINEIAPIISTPEFEKEIKDLYSLFRSFNLSQLNMIGTHEAEKLIALYEIVDKTEVVGNDLAETTWITFNDFNDKPMGLRANEARDDSRTVDLGNDLWSDNRATDIFHTKPMTQFAIDDKNGNIAPFIGSDGNTYQERDQHSYYNVFDTETSRGGFHDTNSLDVHLNYDVYGNGTISVGSSSESVQLWNDYPVLDLGKYLSNLNPQSATEKPLSLVFRMDLTNCSNIAMENDTQYKDFAFTVSVTTKTDNNQQNVWRATWGTGDQSGIYYLVEGSDSSSDKWQKFNTRQNNYLKGDESTGNSLAGNVVWFAIPLSGFTNRRAAGEAADSNAHALSTDSEALRNIAQINFTFATYRKPHTVNIDNIGFTCDANTYGAKDNVKPFDETYDVLSVAANNFARDCASLDVFADRNSAQEKINELNERYNNLSEYQKTLNPVKLAKTQLDNKKQALSFPPIGYGKDSVIDFFNGVSESYSSQLADFKTNRDKLTDDGYMYPGYLRKDTEDGVEFSVDTVKLFNVETAKSIVDMYENGYMSLNLAERAEVENALGGKEALLNTYYAGERIVLLQNNLDSVEKYISMLKDHFYSNDASHDGYYVLDLTDEADRTIDSYKYKHALSVIYGTSFEHEGDGSVDATDHYKNGYYDMSYFEKQLNNVESANGKELAALNPEGMIDAIRNATPIMIDGEKHNGAIFNYAEYVRSIVDTQKEGTIGYKVTNHIPLTEAEWVTLDNADGFFCNLEVLHPEFTYTSAADSAWHALRELFNVYYFNPGTNAYFTSDSTKITFNASAYIASPIDIKTEDSASERARKWIGRTNTVPLHITDFNNFVGVPNDPDKIKEVQEDLGGYGKNTFELVNGAEEKLSFEVLNMNDEKLSEGGKITDLTNTVQGGSTENINFKLNLTSSTEGIDQTHGDYKGTLYISFGAPHVKVFEGSDGKYVSKPNQTVAIEISYQVEEGFTVTIPANTQPIDFDNPQKQEYDFGQLSAIVNLPEGQGVKVSLASGNDLTSGGQEAFNLKHPTENSYVPYSVRFRQSGVSEWENYSQPFVFGANSKKSIYDLEIFVSPDVWDKNDLYAGAVYTDTLTFKIEQFGDADGGETQ